MTEYNRGLLHGQENTRAILEDIGKLKESYLTENEKLTNLLIDAESEIERLRSQNEKLRSDITRLHELRRPNPAHGAPKPTGHNPVA